MSENRIKTIVANILGSLADMPATDVNVPQGPMYLALCGVCDLAGFQTVIGLLETSGLLTATTTTVRLTPKGRKAGEEINQILGEKLMDDAMAYHNPSELVTPKGWGEVETDIGEHDSNGSA